MRRRFPILFWFSIAALTLFAATATLSVVVGIFRNDQGAVIAVIYAGVLFGGVLFLGAPLMVLADIALSFTRHGTWPWKKPIIPQRVDITPPGIIEG